MIVWYKDSLDDACKALALALAMALTDNHRAEKKAIVYKKGQTLLVVRRGH